MAGKPRPMPMYVNPNLAGAPFIGPMLSAIGFNGIPQPDTQPQAWRRGMLAPIEKNTVTGQMRPAVPQSLYDMMNAVQAPGKAAAGLYDLAIDPATGVNYYEGMPEDAAGLAGMMTLGAGAVPAEANALRMGVMRGAPKAPDAPAFTRWFGNSAVVNDDGSPKVVYHGTRADITEFSDKKDRSDRPNGGNYGGIYFTPDVDLASAYGDRGGSIYPVFLSVQNPLRLPSAEYPHITSGFLFRHEIEDLQNAGFDGVISSTGRELVVFEPTQIKSAIANRGTFDPNDPNILRAGAPGVPFTAPTDDEPAARKKRRQLRVKGL